MDGQTDRQTDINGALYGIIISLHWARSRVDLMLNGERNWRLPLRRLHECGPAV